MARTKNDTATILSLIKKVDKSNPDMALALQQLTRMVEGLYIQVNPPTPSSRRSAGNISVNTPNISGFNVTLDPTNVRFYWTPASGVFQYEIRQGSDWATADSIIITSTASANFDPRILNLVYGTYTFLIKGISDAGYYSVTPTSVSFTISQIAAVNLTGTAVQNTALLDWEYPTTTFQIDHYNIYKDSVYIGRVAGTFATIAVVVAGTYEFVITSVDIVGNESDPSPGVSLKLQDPENYILYTTENSDYTGTYTDCEHLTHLGLDGILGPVAVETWQQHFVNNSWTTPQDQIDAGFPYYVQPSQLTGTYIDEYDYGSVLSNITVTGKFTAVTLIGTVTVTVTISGSTDGISWGAYQTGPAAFFSSLRYARIKYTFTAANTESVGFIYNLQSSVNIQLTNDAGEDLCTSTDVGGTEIFYNKPFTAVTAVVGTGLTNAAAIVVVDSISGDSFRCYVFDKNGTRITETVGWHARGTI